MDPYQVLGVSRTASDDEIKKVYRQLCKQYHPDANVGRPDIEQRQKRFLEIQQAYEEIMHQRQGGGARPGSGYNGAAQQQQQQQSPYGDPFEAFFRQYGGTYGSSGRYAYGNTYQQSSSPEMQAAKNYIDAGHYAEALNALGMVPPRERNARWYFLSAMAQSGLHNQGQAIEYARQAVSMEPSNPMYQDLLSNLQSGGRGYAQYGQQYGRHNMGNMANPCTSLCAIYMCSTCLCGGRMPLFCCI